MDSSASSSSSRTPEPADSAESAASSGESAPASPSAADGAENDSSSFEKWLVRFFLIMAFGAAFGIEGMTLFRSYVLDHDGAEAPVEEAAPPLPTLQVGDDLLPDALPTEQIETLALEAHQGDTWTFRMEVALQNLTEQPYELTTFGVLTRSGSVHEKAFRATCPPGDSTRLVAEWKVAASDIPESLVASGRVQVAPDSSVVHARRFRLPRIPVQMVR